MSRSVASSYIRRRMAIVRVPGRYVKPGAARWLALLVRHENEQAAGKSKPECFGQEWDAINNPTCKACPFQVSCLHRCAHVSLLKAQHKAGSHIVLQVAEACGWPAERVHICQQVCSLTKSMGAEQINAAPSRATLPSQPGKRWPRRFMRERRRMPELDYLPVGSKLIRDYHGTKHFVSVLDGTYFYDGEYYPTLYAVASAITGYRDYRRTNWPTGRRLMGNFSARKFFKEAIEKAMPTS